MVSRELCSTVYRAVYEMNNRGEFNKVMFTSADHEVQEEFSKVVDELVDHQMTLQTQVAKRGGCGIKFALSEGTLSATCDALGCPDYPNGPTPPS